MAGPGGPKVGAEAGGETAKGRAPRPLSARIDGLDWPGLGVALDRDGWATTQALLSAEECRKIVALYGRPARFRSRIVMARHNYGSGEYQYFGYPLPRIISSLRRRFYRHLAPIANRWSALLGGAGVTCAPRGASLLYSVEGEEPGL